MSRHAAAPLYGRFSDRSRLGAALVAVCALIISVFTYGHAAHADSPVQVTVADTSILAPTSGSTKVAFSIKLTHPSLNQIRVAYSTRDGSAVAGRDYTATSGTVVIDPGNTAGNVLVTVTNNALASGNRYFNFDLQSATYAQIIRGTAAATIIDTSSPPLISTADTAVTLGYAATGSMSFNVTLSQPSTNIVTVRYSTSDGNARAGINYTAENGTLSFAPGTTSQVVSIPLLGHVPAEQSWYFAFNLGSPTNASIQDATSYGYITDPDRTSDITVDDVSVVKAASGTSTVSVPVRLLTPSTSTVTVNYYTNDGTAVAGTDYVDDEGTLTFAPGTTVQNVPITINGSAANNSPRYFGLTLTGPSAGASTLDTGYVYIESSASQLTQLSVRNTALLKPTSGTGTATFTVSSQPASATPITFTYSTSDGSATSGTDYTAAAGTATIAANATSTTFTVPVTGNQLPTGDRYFYASITNNSAGTIARSSGRAFILSGATTQQAPWISVNPASVVKPTSGSASMNFVVTLSPASGSTATVQYSTADSSAVAGTDYTAVAGTLTFTPGQTSKTVSVPVLPGTTPGPDLQFALNISSATNANIDTSGQYGVIRNQNYPPTLTLGDASVYRAATVAAVITFPVVLSAPSVNPVSVTYSTSNGSASSGTDYIAVSGTLTIPAGQTRGYIGVSIPKSATAPDQEYFYMNFTSVVNALQSNNYAVGYILGNVVRPVVSVSDTNVVTSGSTTTEAFKISLGQPSANTVTVTYATSNGSAVSGSDYTAVSGTATFAPGTTSITVNVPVAANTASVGSEYFYLSLGSPTNAFLGRSTAIATILYPAVTPQLSVNDAIITRQTSGAANETFTVTMAPASTATVTVNFSTSPGSAADGTDYTGVSGTLTFAPGATSKTVNVPIIANAASTPDVYYSLNLSSAVNASVLRSTGYGEIVDKVAPTSGKLYATVNDSSVVAPSTGTSTASFTITVLPAPTTTVRIAYNTSDSNAVDGRDYTDTSGTLTFTAGQTTKTVTVPILAKPVATESRLFYLNIGVSSGPASTFLRSSAYGYISNPQPGAQILAGPDQSVVRGASGSQVMTFTVQLAPAQAVPVTVNYDTDDDNAISGRDYTPVSGTLTFAPGQTSKTVSVTVFGNSTVAGLTEFRLNLTGAVNATIAPYSANLYGYLDPADTFTISGVVTNPGGGALSGVTVTRTGNNQPTVVVTTAADGTFAIPNSVSGAYTLTPSGAGLTYYPTSTVATVSGGNLVGQALIGYTGVVLGGRALLNTGAPVAGAVITRTGNSQGAPTATTNALGYYVIPTTVNGTYSLTSSASGYTASVPASYSPAVSGASVLGQTFIEVKAPYIAVKLATASNAEVNNATVTVSGASSATTTLAVHGNYAFSGLPAGTYTITPTAAGHTFTPATRSVTISATTPGNVSFVEN